MTIYDMIEDDIAAWCASKSLTYCAEDPASDGSDLPTQYLLYSVISDPDSSFYSNQRTRTTFRIQFDLVIPRADGYTLPALFDELEALLIAAGYMPQGNRRQRTDETAQKSYIQKDYYKTMGR
jgi:hypothetical protein